MTILFWFVVYFIPEYLDICLMFFYSCKLIAGSWRLSPWWPLSFCQACGVCQYIELKHV